jgi:hypothetical protein
MDLINLRKVTIRSIHPDNVITAVNQNSTITTRLAEKHIKGETL